MMDSKCLCLDQEDLDQYNLMLDIVEADMKLCHAVIEMIVIINDLVSIKSKYYSCILYATFKEIY